MAIGKKEWNRNIDRKSGLQYLAIFFPQSVYLLFINELFFYISSWELNASFSVFHYSCRFKKTILLFWFFITSFSYSYNFIGLLFYKSICSPLAWKCDRHVFLFDVFFHEEVFIFYFHLVSNLRFVQIILLNFRLSSHRQSFRKTELLFLGRVFVVTSKNIFKNAF